MGLREHHHLWCGLGLAFMGAKNTGLLCLYATSNHPPSPSVSSNYGKAKEKITKVKPLYWAHDTNSTFLIIILYFWSLGLRYVCHKSRKRKKKGYGTNSHSSKHREKIERIQAPPPPKCTYHNFLTFLLGPWYQLRILDL